MTVAEFEQLPMRTWYGLLEVWFVEAYASAFHPPALVLAWMLDELVAEWEQLYPNERSHGHSERAQQHAAAAEARYGATPAR